MPDRNKIIESYFPPENSWEENYRIIIDLGKKLPKFNKEDRREKWLIKGCQSPLWLKAELQGSGRLAFTGDSEALITKGLLALVIEFYTDKKPENILKDKPLFIKSLELEKHFVTGRAKGLAALVSQIQEYAKAFFIISKEGKENLNPRA